MLVRFAAAKHAAARSRSLRSARAVIAGGLILLVMRGAAPAAPGGPRIAASPTQPGAPNVAASTVPVRAAPSPGAFGRPVRVVIPSIGVDAGVVRLGLNLDGTLEVPTDFHEAGWWSGGTVPGNRGPAVIVGHVDSKAGPAVFYRLRELRPGDVVTVHGAGASVAEFVVRKAEWVPKRAFPTERVYGDVPNAALRLITCGGAFDESIGHYLDNLVVYARLSGARLHAPATRDAGARRVA